MTKYRSHVFCDACNTNYKTIKHKRKKPIKCKKCGSIQLRLLSSWEVE